MITPEQIEKKSFKRNFRGYSEEEVDIFLDEVKEDYEKIFKENEALKEQMEMYKNQIGKYEGIEDTLKETLITAQSAAEDTCNAANKKARVVVEEAELDARKIIEKANNRVIEIRREYDSLLTQFKVFKTKFKSLLENEVRNIDDIFSENETLDKKFDKLSVPYGLDGMSETMRISSLEVNQALEEQEFNKTKSQEVLDAKQIEEQLKQDQDKPVNEIFNIK